MATEEWQPLSDRENVNRAPSQGRRSAPSWHRRSASSWDRRSAPSCGWRSAPSWRGRCNKGCWSAQQSLVERATKAGAERNKGWVCGTGILPVIGDRGRCPKPPASKPQPESTRPGFGVPGSASGGIVDNTGKGACGGPAQGTHSARNWDVPCFRVNCLFFPRAHRGPLSKFK